MHAMTIGPCMPLMDVDRHSGSDTYGMSILEAEKDTCIKWLDAKPPGSVVYVSFGSFASLGVEEMEELACGLKASDKYFLWVVRAPEKKTLPRDFIEEPPEKGLVVKWSPQLVVLAHEAVGCFATHCGWNSTLETLSLGVPVVAMPLWTDQPTNAKYVEDIWGVGRRVRAGKKRIFMRDEVEMCIREVMDGEKSEEIRKNSRRLRDLAKKALREGGSSDQNLNELVGYLNAKAKERSSLQLN
uniref:UDP-glycosyltransferase 74E2-like n=1 Tax=Elaeis guineensis var. tenera TaxID=51953 RepID=A0A6I9S3F2_ELAGV|nr:UDP-glycosyltransferase 74E2-like [Elaeis guineensis]